MDFKVDRSSVVEGDIVEVSWNCNGADSVSLFIDNGYKKSNIPLTELVGSKRFRLHRSKGKTVLTLEVIKKGRKQHYQVKVKVKPIEVTPSETVYANGKSGFWEGWKQKFKEARNNWRMNWSQLSPKKQMAFKLLGLILVGSILGLLFPVLLGIGMIFILVYLIIVLLRR